MGRVEGWGQGMGWGLEGRKWDRLCSRRKRPEDQVKDQAVSVCSSESPQICCAGIDSTLLDSSVVLCHSQCRAEGLQKVGKVTGALFDGVHLETSELNGKCRTKWASFFCTSGRERKTFLFVKGKQPRFIQLKDIIS